MSLESYSKSGGPVAVTSASKQIVPADPFRRGIILTNSGSNPVWFVFSDDADPTAAADGKGFSLASAAQAVIDQGDIVKQRLNAFSASGTNVAYQVL